MLIAQRAQRRKELFASLRFGVDKDVGNSRNGRHRPRYKLIEFAAVFAVFVQVASLRCKLEEIYKLFSAGGNIRGPLLHNFAPSLSSQCAA